MSEGPSKLSCVALTIGIVGLPNVGKSTLFNALTRATVLAANYPFATIEPNVGVVPLPDARLDKLAELFHSARVVPATVSFVDIAGIVRGASEGEGLGNQFLANIRECDAIVHVVRCFDDSNVIHVDGQVDPIRDIETINLELLFSDMEIIERRRSKVERQARNDKTARKEAEMLSRLYAFLEEGNMASSFRTADEDEDKYLSQYDLLTGKPVIYAANVSEEDMADDGADNAYVRKVRDYAGEHKAQVFVVCAQMEAEISELEDDERQAFLEDLGLKESGLDKLVRASYELLGLISYLTTGEDETRAWTITKGTKAPQAAGKIHTDFERGFIAAEVVKYTDLIEQGSMHAAKEAGLVGLQGKEYVVEDGDIINFRFNV